MIKLTRFFTTLKHLGLSLYTQDIIQFIKQLCHIKDQQKALPSLYFYTLKIIQFFIVMPGQFNGKSNCLWSTKTEYVCPLSYMPVYLLVVVVSFRKDIPMQNKKEWFWLKHFLFFAYFKVVEVVVVVAHKVFFMFIFQSHFCHPKSNTLYLPHHSTSPHSPPVLFIQRPKNAEINFCVRIAIFVYFQLKNENHISICLHLSLSALSPTSNLCSSKALNF